MSGIGHRHSLQASLGQAQSVVGRIRPPSVRDWASRFIHASQDGFFLCIEASDPQFDRDRTKEFLSNLRAKEVMEVPH
jgi:hypothetical protein